MTSAADGWGRHALRLAAWSFAALMLVPAALQAHIPDAPGWTLRFGDDFNGPAGQLPSRDRWRFDIGHHYPGGPPDWGTREIQRYTDSPDNVSLDGHGHLRITALRDRSGQWTSARIETSRADFKAPEDGVLRIEARIRMPEVSGQAALGYWPAFWALGGSYRHRHDWPRAGEFDVMENVNGLDSVWGTLHCGTAPGGPCGEPNGIGQRVHCPAMSCQGAFHVYAFEWDRSTSPNELRWYVDGHLYHRVTQDQLPARTWREITGQHGYFLLLDLAMGGNFSYAMDGGTPTPVPATEPGHAMLVDYVAAWTRGGD